MKLHMQCFFPYICEWVRYPLDCEDLALFYSELWTKIADIVKSKCRLTLIMYFSDKWSWIININWYIVVPLLKLSQ